MWDNNLPTFDTQFSFFALIPFAGQLTKRFESGILLFFSFFRRMPDSKRLVNWTAKGMRAKKEK